MPESFLLKLQARSLQFIKDETHRGFPVNFMKFLRTTFFENILWRQM